MDTMAETFRFVSGRVRGRLGVVLFAALMLVLLLAPTAYGHSHNRVWGPGGSWGNCFIRGDHSHSGDVLDANTVPATMYARCTGVEVKASYKVDGFWRLAQDRDTRGSIYAAHVSRGFDIFSYSDHNGKDTVWVGARLWH